MKITLLYWNVKLKKFFGIGMAINKDKSNVIKYNKHTIQNIITQLLFKSNMETSITLLLLETLKCLTNICT
jgi:hypothetical protein